MTPDLLVSSISFALQKSFYLELVDDIGCIKHFFHIMKIRESKAFHYDLRFVITAEATFAKLPTIIM